MGTSSHANDNADCHKMTSLRKNKTGLTLAIFPSQTRGPYNKDPTI